MRLLQVLLHINALLLHVEVDPLTTSTQVAWFYKEILSCPARAGRCSLGTTGEHYGSEMRFASITSLRKRCSLVPGTAPGLLNGAPPCHAESVLPCKCLEETNQDERFQCCHNKRHMALLRRGLHVQPILLKSHLLAPWDVTC